MLSAIRFLIIRTKKIIIFFCLSLSKISGYFVPVRTTSPLAQPGLGQKIEGGFSADAAVISRVLPTQLVVLKFIGNQSHIEKLHRFWLDDEGHTQWQIV